MCDSKNAGITAGRSYGRWGLNRQQRRPYPRVLLCSCPETSPLTEITLYFVILSGLSNTSPIVPTPSVPGEQDPAVAQAVATELLPFHDRGDWDGALKVRGGQIVSTRCLAACVARYIATAVASHGLAQLQR